MVTMFLHSTWSAKQQLEKEYKKLGKRNQIYIKKKDKTPWLGRVFQECRIGLTSENKLVFWFIWYAN